MKFLIPFILFLSCLVQNSWSNNPLRGVNYDPSHSMEFARAVGLNDKQGMMDAISADLDKIAELQNRGINIRFLKTFYTSYSSFDKDPSKQVEVNIAEVVNRWNQNHPANALQLALGVHEYRVGADNCKDESSCIALTQVQINAAILAANQYAPLVDRIIVGNADVNFSNMEMRIAKDITTIKKQLTYWAVRVGTAQSDDHVWEMFNRNSFALVKNAADFIGANVYPFWDGYAYGDAPFINSPAKWDFEQSWNSITRVQDKEIIGTGEGWPSAGDSWNRAKPSPIYAHDYFMYWYFRDNRIPQMSYYFSLFDQTPTKGAGGSWGIFSADGYSNLLGSPQNPQDFSKPLAPEHVLVRFANQIGYAGDDSIKSRVAALYACTEDWNPSTKTQGECYPINGLDHSGDIAKLNQRQLMIDISGKTYASLKAVYYDDNNEPKRLCYINTEAMKKLGPNTITLFLRKADGDYPCGIF